MFLCVHVTDALSKVTDQFMHQTNDLGVASPTLSLLRHWCWLMLSFTGCPWDQKLPLSSVTSAGSPKPQSISPCVCCAGELRGTVTLGVLYRTSSASRLIVFSRVIMSCDVFLCGFGSRSSCSWRTDWAMWTEGLFRPPSRGLPFLTSIKR